ncbi:MAG: YceH family protein [Elusimicrobia bacterium]|nr:YceH family protein [Elusimicrobiota bacterium]
MIEQLTPLEARILGSLVEKSLTTPELYPLTLNSLVNACNQKTSRDPVMTLGHNDVENALNGLVERKLAARIHEPGARAAKYTHRIDILLGSEDPKAIGAVCILLLRGAQTPGELKGRTERLCRFESTAEVEALMAELSSRVDGPIVRRLPRQPGQMEARYQQLFTAGMDPPSPEGGSSPLPEGTPAAEPDRVARLEARVAALEAAFAAFRPK